MNAATITPARWEQSRLDSHLGGEEFDYDDFEDLPCEYVPALRRWRDVETMMLVSADEAIERNDAACARQVERAEDDDRMDAVVMGDDDGGYLC